MAIYEFFTSRNNGTTADTYVGQAGRLFYDGFTGVLKISDGVTPGGANIQLPVATTSRLGGIKAGPGANVSVDGTLTIDTTGLPLTIGNIEINDATISAVNANADLNLESNGSGNVQLIGNVHFHTTAEGPSGNPYFTASGDGQITMYVPQAGANAGAVKIIGSTTGDSEPPGITGAMLHVTGNYGTPNRIYYDGNGDYVAWVGRRWNGNLAAQTQVLAGQDVLRINATAYNLGGMPNVAIAQIGLSSLEDQTTTAQGSKIGFTVTPIGSSAASRVEVANVTVAYGLGATKITTGNINVGASGTITTPRVVINDGGVRAISDGTAATIDFSKDSMVLWYRPSGTGTVTLTNYVAGATVRLHINIGATSRDINYGVAAGSNSSTGATVFNGSGAGSTDISDTTMQLVYTCYDGTAANTYVAVTTI
jgi:hypothetical protein